MNTSMERTIAGLVRFLVTMLTLSLALALILFLLERPLGAAVCPRCFGFRHVVDQIYVQGNMPAAEQSKLETLLATGHGRIRKFFGRNESDPKIFVCTSSSCLNHLGAGGASMGSVGAFIMFLSPESVNPVSITHELALVELRRRIGVFHTLIGSVPAWFAEGVAVIASDDRQFIARPGAGINRCLANPHADLPVDMPDWNQYAAVDPRLYAEAACRVDLWMEKSGGSEAVSRLLSKISDGKSFEVAYR